MTLEASSRIEDDRKENNGGDMSRETYEEMPCFQEAEVLLPELADLRPWAVIACDQFTSQPEYWEETERIAGEGPSALRLILPEVYLDQNAGEKIAGIQKNMHAWLQDGLFHAYPDCFVYTERRMESGICRRGVVGMVDLEAYDYTGREDASVRATEETVTERIPPRMAIRRDAPLELPHILLLCNDAERKVIEPLDAMKERLPLLYDFELMQHGGHIRGWLVAGENAAALRERLKEYEQAERKRHPQARLVYAVGDGNHSLATAKACYEERKRLHPEMDFSRHPSRYALCELNNIHDPDQRFEPIHRVVKDCDAALLLQDAQKTLNVPGGTAVPWISEGKRGTLYLPKDGNALALSHLQGFLDEWLCTHSGTLDYIHGEKALSALADHANTVGFLLPAIEKESLFPGILHRGTLPRKTFSMGEAEEKRYYLEARRIL